MFKIDRDLIKKVILFTFWGTLTTLLNVVLYYAFRYIKIPVSISTALAWFLCVLFAFVTNRRYVFKGQEYTKKQIIREIVLFYGSRLFSGIMDVLIMVLLLQYTIIFASVLMLVALGGCFSEHSGIINLGLEGIMVVGALGGALIMNLLPANTGAFMMVVITTIAAVVFGMLYSCLLGVAAIRFKADQTLIGTAMNMLATAAATVFVSAFNAARNPDNTSSTLQYISQKNAFIIRIAGFEFNWFMLLAVILLGVSWFVLYKTRFGLRLMACGENPQAADSVGINVKKMRWAGVLISGALGGLGGIVYILAGVSEWKFEVGVAGFGFLALAVMIFGQWKPTKIAAAAVLFGFFRALSNVYTAFPFLAGLGIPSTVYNMMPYIISLIILAFTSKNSKAPKAEGIPYDKGMR